jgi:hypothetical protein
VASPCSGGGKEKAAYARDQHGHGDVCRSRVVDHLPINVLHFSPAGQAAAKSVRCRSKFWSSAVHLLVKYSQFKCSEKEGHRMSLCKKGTATCNSCCCCDSNPCWSELFLQHLQHRHSLSTTQFRKMQSTTIICMTLVPDLDGLFHQERLASATASATETESLQTDTSGIRL